MRAKPDTSEPPCEEVADFEEYTWLYHEAWGHPLIRWLLSTVQGLDLEHWAAFRESFDRLTTLLREIGSGARGRPPATIVCLGGDLHHAYLADVAFPRGSGVESAVYQAVCSPFRNPLSSREQMAIRFGAGRTAELLGRALNRAAGRRRPDIRWRFIEGPYFDNQFATLELEGRRAGLRLEKTSPGDDPQPELETVFERRLA